MGQPAAKQGDKVVATDTHLVVVPSQPPQPPQPLPHPFDGVIGGALSTNVRIMGLPAATAGSTAQNSPPHVPTPPGTAFSMPPSNRATIQTGSPTVNINGKPAARHGDTALTCNDPADAPVGTVVVAASTVNIG